MKYTYGIAIMTFNGMKFRQVEHLIHSLGSCSSLSKMSELLIIEDRIPLDGPQIENHNKLVDMLLKYPQWKLITSHEWGNAQGTAKLALESSKSDYIFLLEDDQLATGDPFARVIDWMERGDEELIELTGAIYLTHYQASTDLVKLGVFPPYKTHRELLPEFYHDPFKTWFCGNIREGRFLNPGCHFPKLGMVAHGQGSMIARKAYVKSGGYDQRWHAFDQVLSYRIWLKTSYLIYEFPSDPFYHIGAAAQAGDFDHTKATHQGKVDRCIEIFGETDQQLESGVVRKAVEGAALHYQDKLYWAYSNMGYLWKYI